MSSATLAYSTNTDSDDISIVDTVQNREIERIPVGGSPRGSVKFDRAKAFGYVSNCAGNTISVIDVSAQREVAKIAVGLAPRGVAISEDDKYAFVSNSGDNSISVVDLTRRTQAGAIATGKNPRHMSIVPGKGMVAVAVWGGDAIGLFRYTGEIGATVKASPRMVDLGRDSRPYSVTVDATGSKVYVANTQADYMSIVDLTTLQAEHLKVGYGGRAVALTQDGKYAFVTVETENAVAVIDLASSKVATKVEVGGSPRGIALDQVSSRMFIPPFSRAVSGVGERNALSVFDVSNPLRPRFERAIGVGLGPCSVSLLSR